MVLSWDPPVDHPNGHIRRYIVNVTELETDTHMLHISAGQSLTVESLHPFYQYKYVVLAETIAQGPWSQPLVVQQPEASRFHYYH